MASKYQLSGDVPLTSYDAIRITKLSVDFVNSGVEVQFFFLDGDQVQRAKTVQRPLGNFNAFINMAGSLSGSTAEEKLLTFAPQLLGVPAGGSVTAISGT